MLGKMQRSTESCLSLLMQMALRSGLNTDVQRYQTVWDTAAITQLFMHFFQCTSVVHSLYISLPL